MQTRILSDRSRSATGPSMDLPQGPNDSPDIVLICGMVLNRLKEINSSGCSKSDCLIALRSVTDGILDQVVGDPWEIISRGYPAAPGRELVTTSGEKERRRGYNNRTKITTPMTLTTGKDQESVICSEHHHYEDQQEGVKVCTGVESHNATGMTMGLVPNCYYIVFFFLTPLTPSLQRNPMKENNAADPRRYETTVLMQMQRRRNDLWQKLYKVLCSPPNTLLRRTHSQSKNKLSETFCSSSNSPPPQSFLSTHAKGEKTAVLHEYPPSHEEPKSAKTNSEELSNNSLLSAVPLCYMPSSDCGHHKWIDSDATALCAVPEVKMASIISNRKEILTCAEEEDEDEISVDLSNCHIEKLQTILKKGQRRRVIEA